MSRLITKPTICICEYKGADQLRSTCNCEADQRLCFRYSDSTVPPLLKPEISSVLALICDCTGRFVLDLVGNHIVGFPTRRLICCTYNNRCLMAYNISQVLHRYTGIALAAYHEPMREKIWVPTRSDTNRHVQSQKLARGWKFWI